MAVSWQRYLRSTQKKLKSAKKKNGKRRKTNFKAVEHVFARILETLPPIDTKIPHKSKKRHGEFKTGKHTIMPVSWQRYLWSMQKNFQSVKKWMANTIKTVSKPVNICFWPYLGKSTFDRRSKPSKVGKKKMVNAVKLVSKPANTRFRSYLGNATSYWLKNTSNVLKKERKRFKTGEQTFLLVSRQRYLRLTQKTSKVLKNERRMP